MIQPTAKAALLAGGTGVVVTGIVLYQPAAWSYCFWLLLIAAGVMLVDASRMPPARRVSLHLDGPSALFVGHAERARMLITSSGILRSTRLAIELPEDCIAVEYPDHTGTLPAGETEIPFDIYPVRRGMARIPAVWVGWRSPLGFASVYRRIETGADVPVVPNIRAVRQTAIAFENRDSLIGSKAQQLQGDGSEFDALRDYVPGLDHRAIDWKHTARHRSLVCKEFRAERNHQIVIALDNGRLMGEPIGGIAKLDHAMTGALQLSYAAQRDGDRVGMAVFNADLEQSLPPVGGPGGFTRLQRIAADIAYTTTETNFTLSLMRIATQLKRRSLIIVMTDFEDTITAEHMIENIGRLAQRHLVLFVTFAETGLEKMRLAKVNSLEDMGRAVVADTGLRERRIVLERLRRLGVECIETSPEKFGTELLNSYIRIKQRDEI